MYYHSCTSNDKNYGDVVQKRHSKTENEKIKKKLSDNGKKQLNKFQVMNLVNTCFRILMTLKMISDTVISDIVTAAVT